MKKFLLIAAASLTLAATVPANAQVYFGAGPGGVGVREVIPITVGVIGIGATATPLIAMTVD